MFIGKPELYNNNNKDYVWAICRCPVPSIFAIKIPKEEGKIAYDFKCKECGTSGTIYSK